MTTHPLTEAEISELAAVWYKKLDIHAPMVEVLPMLADEELEMVFPEATIKGWAGFEGWFQKVIRLFFDEVHQVVKCEAKIDGTKAVVAVVVHWEASVWNPPAEKSKRISLTAYQTWEMKRCSKTGHPLITKYTVDKLDYDAGSAQL